MKLGIGGHHNPVSLNDEWLTPINIIKSLGEFDLDPCSPINRPWDTAKNHLTIEDDGFNCDWKGRVWLNPPYGKETEKWMDRLKKHGNGIGLIFARTETKIFFKHIWNDASAILFLEGRLYFHYVDGTRASANAGAPSCLVAYGWENVIALENSGIKGKIIYLKTNKGEICSSQA